MSPHYRASHRGRPLRFNILLVSSAGSQQSVDILTERAQTVTAAGVNYFYCLGQDKVVQQMQNPEQFCPTYLLRAGFCKYELKAAKSERTQRIQSVDHHASCSKSLNWKCLCPQSFTHRQTTWGSTAVPVTLKVTAVALHALESNIFIWSKANACVSCHCKCSFIK